jgi:myo-inositol-1(or 4)-monophosphatase
MSRMNDLCRIRQALGSVMDLVSRFGRSKMAVTYSDTGDPTTALDGAINQMLLRILPIHDEGWLSEDSKDDLKRLYASRVWVVDPIDGTREFVNDIPEWCVSVGLIEGQCAVAGGVLNPSTGEMFLGSVEDGLEIINPTKPTQSSAENLPRMLVSRREHEEGKWTRFHSPELEIKPVGSIAYRLALVASGSAAATCTFEPRSEWDVAGGVALLHAASGRVQTSTGDTVLFNQERSQVPTLCAFGKNCPSSLSKEFGVDITSIAGNTTRAESLSARNRTRSAIRKANGIS